MLLLAAVGVTVLLATTLLVAGPMYGDAIATAGLRAELDDAPVRSGGLEVTTGVPLHALPELDTRVREVLAGLGEDRIVVRTLATTRSLVLPGVAGPDQLLSVTGMDDLSAHATVVAGRLPEPGGSARLEVAMHERAAATLGLSPGRDLDLSVKLDGTRLPARLVGTYRPTDPQHPYWWDDPLLLDGVATGGNFTTFALLAPHASLAAAHGEGHVSASWRAHLVPAGLVPSDVPELRRATARLAPRLHDIPGFELTLRTELPRVLLRAENALESASGAVTSTTLQLGAFALYALVLAAGLLVETRETSTALLRARGADGQQLGGAAAVEAALLVVPAVLVAPWLAAAVIAVSDASGVVSAAGLTLAPEVSGASYLLALAAGAAAFVALVWPTLRSSQTYVEARVRQGRRPGAGLLQRKGLDLALAVLALVGLWQLRQLGDRAAAPATDPVVVVGPALAILAGGLLALRLVPVVGRVLAAPARRGRGLAAMLASRQIARRPIRAQRSALLVVLAVTIAVYADAYGGTWQASQRDQAELRTGADIAVFPSALTRPDVPPGLLGPSYRQLPGVTAATPVHDSPVTGGRGLGNPRLIAYGFDAPATVRPAEALGPGVTSVAERSTLPSLALPPGTTHLEIDVRAVGPVTERAELRVVTVDGAANLRRVAQVLELGGPPEPRTFELGSGAVAPLDLVALELHLTAPETGGEAVPVAALIRAITAVTPDGRQPLALRGVDWQVFEPSLRRVAASPTTSFEPGPPMRLSVTTGVSATGPQAVVWRVLPGGGATSAAPLPAVITSGLASRAQLTVGDVFSFQDGGAALEARVERVVTRLPAAADEPEAIGVDGVELAARRYLQDGTIAEAARWLLATGAAPEDQLLDALRSPPFSSSEVVSRHRLAQQLQRNPVTLGVVGALQLGAWAALLFAVLGYAINAVVDIRRRRSEFAFARALGTTSRLVRRWLVLEATATVGLSVAIGLLLGLAVARTVLPGLPLTATGAPPIPAATFITPWATAATVAAGAITVGLLVPALLARAVARLGVASALRLGEEA